MPFAIQKVPLAVEPTAEADAENAALKKRVAELEAMLAQPPPQRRFLQLNRLKTSNRTAKVRRYSRRSFPASDRRCFPGLEQVRHRCRHFLPTCMGSVAWRR